MTATETRPRRTYTRRQQTGKRVTLNEFQSDVVLSALRNEIRRIREDRNTPESLKLLAIRELNSVVEQLDEPEVLSGQPAES